MTTQIALYEQWRRAAVLPTRREDWGPRGRGSGKRIGGGEVRGAMSDPPTGMRVYRDDQHAVGVTPALWDEIRVLTEEDRAAVIGGLQAGHPADEVLRLVYTVGHARGWVRDHEVA